MVLIDIILAALIGFGVVKGLYKGFFVEVASLLALLLGAYGAAHFSNHAGAAISKHFDWSEKIISITAFVATFVAIVFAISLAGKALTKLANFASLGILNKLAGGFFGGLKAVLLISVVLLVFDGLNTNLTIVSEADIKASILYKKVQSLAPIILPSIIGENTPLEFTHFP
jgi:membrane protein required for colicin V production